MSNTPNDDELRHTAGDRKDDTYEALIDSINAQIADLSPPAEVAETPELPVVFVVGIPRSGSTLLAQLVAETGAFGYCSNLLARFWRNPYFGLQIQQLAEPLLPGGDMTYRSARGRTQKWYEPHEFGYFWERFLPFDQHHEPGTRPLSKVDWAGLNRDIAALEYGFGQPMFFKNLILSMVIGALADHVPGSRFVEIRREPLAVANSLYRSRIREFGDPERWFSARPANYETLQECPPEKQIVAQMSAIERHVRRVEQRVASERWLRLEYASVCEEPERALTSIFSLAGREDIPALDEIPEGFDRRGARELDGATNERLAELLADRGFEHRPMAALDGGDSEKGER